MLFKPAVARKQLDAESVAVVPEPSPGATGVGEGATVPMTGTREVPTTLPLRLISPLPLRQPEGFLTSAVAPVTPRTSWRAQISERM